MGKLSNIGHALYEGTVSIDFVGRKWLWYAISGLILLAAVGGLAGRGLNLGIEFQGGVEYQVSMSANQATDANIEKVRKAVAQKAADADIPAAASPIVNSSNNSDIRVQTEPLTADQSTQIANTIRETVGVSKDAISRNAIGATWGAQVANRALLGLGVFLILVTLFIWAYFREWKMSVGALVALAHDLLITVGVYALSGFEVTPATVTGILTNLVIFAFNLFPVPPLDGGRIMTSLLPMRYAAKYAQLEAYGFFIVMGLAMLGFLKYWMAPVMMAANTALMALISPLTYLLS